MAYVSPSRGSRRRVLSVDCVAELRYGRQAKHMTTNIVFCSVEFQSLLA